MTSPTVRSSVGDRQVFDESSPFESGPCWIAADTSHEKYGWGLDHLPFIGDACPPCPRVSAIGREEPLLESREKLLFP